MSRVRFVLVSALLLALLAPATPASAENLPPGIRSFFVIDTSSSSKSVDLWKTGLRPSIVSKLRQPFGLPKVEPYGKGKAPSDIAVSIINENSQSAPLVQIVSSRDADKIWGVILKVGDNSERLKRTTPAFFGPTGAYTTLVDKFLENNAIVTKEKCISSVSTSFSTTRMSTSKYKSEATSLVCSTFMRISANLALADKNVIPSAYCSQASNACSDVVGAVRRAAAFADQSARESQRPFCLAIASDMVNFGPGSLSTKAKVKESKSLEEAANWGSRAAQDVGALFPKRIKVIVYTVGQGGQSDTSIPRDRLAYLDAYWKGFWTSAGVKEQSRVQAISDACKG